jgi:hypothetical protein
MRAFALLLLATSCRREPPPVHADPVVVDAAPPPSPPPPLQSPRILRQGRVIDRRAARVVATIAEKAPQLEDGAYFVDRAGTLHAVDLASATERWSVKPPFVPAELVMTSKGAAIAREKQIALYDASGTERVFAFGGHVSHLVARGDDLLFLEGEDRLQRIDSAGRLAPVTTLPFKVFGWGSALRVLEDRKTTCAIAEPAGVLEVACFDRDGAMSSRRTLDLRAPSDPKGTSFTIRSVDDRYALFAAGPFFLTGARRAAVVRLSDGAIIAKVEDAAAAIVERDDGSVSGLLVVQPELRMLEIDGTLRWKAPSPSPHDEAASALARGGRVFVDVYPPISSGSTLVALDEKTGATAWKADVQMLPIAHSEYFNEARLSFFERRIALRGDESSVWTYQLFDEIDGKRALAESQLTW